METSVLKNRIATWLATTRGADLPVGLDAEEAEHRARELFRAILDKQVAPESLELDEELKQVLSVLVRQLSKSVADPEERHHEADAVYQFIRRLPWPEDPLSEQQDLLLECAEIGWGAIGLSIAEVTRRRTAAETAEIHDFRTDPISLRNRAVRIELRPEEARSIALQFLEGGVAAEQTAANADVVLALCGRLRELTDSTPALVAEKAETLYRCVSESVAKIGFFDEQDYFLGELALIAGAAFRHKGRYEEAGRWLDRAEAAFRHIVNAAPQLASVAYARLALYYQLRRFGDVLELTPSLIRTFERLGMTLELRKTEFLTAMSLKQCGRESQAFAKFWELRNALEKDSDPALLGHVLIETAVHLTSEGRREEALAEYSRAAELLANANREMALAHLRVTIGEGLREKGDFDEALVAFRSAVAIYGKLQMTTFVAYTRVFVADVLLRLNRAREADWEILAALPTIEEQKMVPEGFAAVALLKESVLRRKADPNALRELREHLQANQK